MARYDEQPGYSVNIPGVGDFNPNSSGQTAPGSSSPGPQPGPYHEGGGELIGSPVAVSRPYDSVASGIPEVQQTTLSTTSAINAMIDKVSGADQTQDVSAGKVWQPRGKGA